MSHRWDILQFPVGHEERPKSHRKKVIGRTFAHYRAKNEVINFPKLHHFKCFIQNFPHTALGGLRETPQSQKFPCSSITILGPTDGEAVTVCSGMTYLFE